MQCGRDFAGGQTTLPRMNTDRHGFFLPQMDTNRREWVYYGGKKTINSLTHQPMNDICENLSNLRNLCAISALTGYKHPADKKKERVALRFSLFESVELRGIEPLTSALRTQRSPI